MRDNRLEEVVILSNDLSEVLKDANTLIFDANKAIYSLRAAANEVDDIFMNHTIARAGGAASGVIGGIFLLSSGIGTIVTAGFSVPFLFAATTFAVVGGATCVGASIREAILTSKKIEKADKDMNKVVDRIQRIFQKIQDWSNEEEGSTQRGIFERLESVFLRQGSSVLKLCVAPGCPAAEKIMKAELTKRSVKEALLKAGKESIDDVATAGKEALKVNGQLLGRILIALGAVCMVWDAIHLTISIRNIVLLKESEVAKALREKADHLEKYLKSCDAQSKLLACSK